MEYVGGCVFLNISRTLLGYSFALLLNASKLLNRARLVCAELLLSSAVGSDFLQYLISFLIHCFNL